MKPFNLAEALAGKPVVTRDGRKVQRVIHVPEMHDSFKVLAIVDGWMLYVGESGRYCPKEDNRNDLFMASEKKRAWGVLLKAEWGRSLASPVYDSQEIAFSMFKHDPRYIATVPIEWEE